MDSGCASSFRLARDSVRTPETPTPPARVRFGASVSEISPQFPVNAVDSFLKHPPLSYPNTHMNILTYPGLISNNALRPTARLAHATVFEYRLYRVPCSRSRETSLVACLTLAQTSAQISFWQCRPIQHDHWTNQGHPHLIQYSPSTKHLK